VTHFFFKATKVLGKQTPYSSMSYYPLLSAYVCRSVCCSILKKIPCDVRAAGVRVRERDRVEMGKEPPTQLLGRGGGGGGFILYQPFYYGDQQ
jgi:hypothetical protein